MILKIYTKAKFLKVVYLYFRLKELGKYQKKIQSYKDKEPENVKISVDNDSENESLENLQEQETLDNETIDESSNS